MANPQSWVIRPAAEADTDAAADLLLELPGGLTDIFPRGAVARRVARAAFLADRSVLGRRWALVAEPRDGQAAALMIRITGAGWDRLRIPTGLVMIRAAKLSHGLSLVWRGALQDRLIPPVPGDSLYIPALVVAPPLRGLGAGSELLRRALEEAVAAGLRAVSLDVDAANDRAIGLYLRHGFQTVSEQRIPPRRGLTHLASLRMERAVGK